jgi:hypothetical protein
MEDGRLLSRGRQKHPEGWVRGTHLSKTTTGGAASIVVVSRETLYSCCRTSSMTALLPLSTEMTLWRGA